MPKAERANQFSSQEDMQIKAGQKIQALYDCLKQGIEKHPKGKTFLRSVKASRRPEEIEIVGDEQKQDIIISEIPIGKCIYLIHDEIKNQKQQTKTLRVEKIKDGLLFELHITVPLSESQTDPVRKLLIGYHLNQGTDYYIHPISEPIQDIKTHRDLNANLRRVRKYFSEILI